MKASCLSNLATGLSSTSSDSPPSTHGHNCQNNPSLPSNILQMVCWVRACNYNTLEQTGKLTLKIFTEVCVSEWKLFIVSSAWKAEAQHREN